MSNLYELLGVRRDATMKEIKKAYHKAAMELHPDKVKDKTEEAADLFQQIIDAYTVLSNEVARKEYDDSLAQKEIEIERVNKVSESRKQMIDELEMKEKIAKKQGTDPLKPFRDSFENAMANMKTENASYSFNEYEKVIVNTLLNM